MCVSSCAALLDAVKMAKRARPSRKLQSDPDYLSEYMETVPSDSSDDDFDGYLSDEDAVDINDSASEESDQPLNSTDGCQGRQLSMC